jgi:hypothetical protein
MQKTSLKTALSKLRGDEFAGTAAAVASESDIWTLLSFVFGSHAMMVMVQPSLRSMQSMPARALLMKMFTCQRRNYRVLFRYGASPAMVAPAKALYCDLCAVLGATATPSKLSEVQDKLTQSSYSLLVPDRPVHSVKYAAVLQSLMPETDEKDEHDDLSVVESVRWFCQKPGWTQSYRVLTSVLDQFRRKAFRPGQEAPIAEYVVKLHVCLDDVDQSAARLKALFVEMQRSWK